VHNADDLLRHRLSFPVLAVSDADVVEAGKSDVVLRRGAQFFQAVSDVPVWCSANIWHAGTFLSDVVLGTTKSQFCLVDQNRDGAPDGFFKHMRNLDVLPNLRGKVPALTPLAHPIHLRPVPPDQLQSKYFVSLRYRKNSGRGIGRPYFNFVVSSDRPHDEIYLDTFQGDDGRYPQTIRAAGAAVVIDVDASGGVTAKVLEGFKPGLFHVTVY